MIEVGRVYLIWCAFTRPPKDKFCLCVTDDPWFFLINSDINAFVASNPALASQQILVPQAGHAFLSYDSWLNCSEPVTITQATVDQQIGFDPTRKKDMISAAVIAAAISSLESSATLPKRKAEKIKACLAPLVAP